MNKAKRLFIVIISLSVTIIGSAQINYGLKGGLNYSNISNVSENYKVLPTFHFGGILNLGINEYFSIQPELLFTGKGYKFNNTTMYYPSVIEESNPFYIEIPVLLKLKTKVRNGINVYGAIGPYFGYCIAEQGQVKMGDIKITEKFDWRDKEFSYYKSTDIGITLNAGIEIYHLILSINYDIGINNISSSISRFDYGRHRVIGISLGYLFNPNF